MLKKITKSDELEKLNAAERARSAFEELGPTFVKFGQLLATRPNLIPKDFVEEFKKFHDQVAPVPFSEIRKILEEEYPQGINTIFSHIDETPIAAASIAQVHYARLKTGQEVVIKVQRPGIVDIIENDLNVLYQLAELLEEYVPESRLFRPVSMVDEFFKTLELETDFAIEANNMAKFTKNFEGDTDIIIPEVYEEFLTSRVLVMEQIKGISLSDHNTMAHSQIDRDKIVAIGLKSFFRMVFRDGLFHGDLHEGNIFIVEGSKVAMVDFGVVGRLSSKTRDSIANMFVCLFTEDYETLANEYLDLAPFNPHVDFDQFAHDLRSLLAPLHGVTFKNVRLGKILQESSAIASKHQVVLPSELMLFFKAVVTVEGMGRNLVKDFDILPYAMDFAQEIVKTKYDPQKIVRDLTTVGHDLRTLLYSLPRQLKNLLRRANDPHSALEINIRQIEDLRRSIEISGTLTYLGIVVASLIIASTMALNMGIGAHFQGFPVISIIGYFLAAVMAALASYNYLKKG